MILVITSLLILETFLKSFLRVSDEFRFRNVKRWSDEVSVQHRLTEITQKIEQTKFPTQKKLDAKAVRLCSFRLKMDLT